MHLAADGRCRPLALVLTPGHHGDGPQLEYVLSQISVSRTGAGRPRTRPDRVLAEGLHVPHEPLLTATTWHRPHHSRTPRPAKPPEEARFPRRPAGFDSEIYKKRNTVERAINRLKGFRAVATRYEKRAYIYLGTVTLAALMI
ncbi:transposase [Streptomyces sp. NPDC054883]